MKKFILLIGIIIFLSLVGGSVYYFLNKAPEWKSSEMQTSHPPCLRDNETVDYTINWREKTGPVDIVIKEKETGEEIYKFTIDSILYAAYPIQIRRCGVYALRVFNYNPKISKQVPGYKEEIWYYHYNGEGEPLLLLGMKDDSGNFHDFFSLEFKVDFLEVYLALIKGYLGQEDFAIVINEIATKNNVFSLKYEDIIKKYPDVFGNFALDEWTQDSHYLWGRLHYGATVTSFFRIERDSWDIDVFIPTVRILDGTAFNPEYGYVTYDTGPGWIGIDIIAEQIYDEWRKAGKKVDFYVYNLFTKEKTLLATTDDPSWSFKPKWLSDTELEYELPTGEKKIYKINEK